MPHCEEKQIITDDEGKSVPSEFPDAAPTEITISPDIEGRLLRKLDLHLGPLFALLYFVCYLDRANIGNAAVAGLANQLSLSGTQLSTAVSVFYASYVVFELPATLVLRVLRPHRVLAFLTFAWSLVTICSAFVRSYATLAVVRVLLGFCEAGFFPCASLYISMCWKREEQVSRSRFPKVFYRTELVH